jgi:L-aminopeptidase/D-esterase-like protein
MIRPGARNLITDVAGILVGNAEDVAGRTGVTVVLPERPAVCGGDVRGGAPGTRETDALDPTCLVDAANGIVLSGGSAFGLEAASAAMAWLAERGRGYRVREACVPIVPAAVLFDLLNGGDRSGTDYRVLGRRACDAAAAEVALGNAGAGLGATVGPLKGGLGSASFATEGFTVGALVAANSHGSPVIPGTPVLWAWPFEQGGELGGQRLDRLARADDLSPRGGTRLANTTLAVVAVDRYLTPAQARRVAIMAHDGIARALHPAHTPYDGDSVFALSTGDVPVDNDALLLIGSLAADCVTRAIGRAVVEAEDLGGIPCYRSLFGQDPSPEARRQEG